MPFTGLAGRIAYAVLIAVIAFILIIALAVGADQLSPEVGTLLRKLSLVISLLVGLCVFFFGRKV